MTTHVLKIATVARAVALGAVTALLATACSGASVGSTGTSSADADAHPVSGGTLTVGQTDLPPCLDPAITPYANHAGRALLDNLFDQDLKTGKPVPWLATGYTVSDDQKSYTITLRKGVTFSNGEPFTAADVKADFDNAIEFKKTDGRNVAAANLAGYTGSTVIDDHTITVSFDQPRAGFVQALTEKALGIEWAGSIVGKDYDTRCTEGPIGTGPFVLSENVPDDHITVVKRKDYDWASPNALHKGDAYLDAVKFVEISDPGVLTDTLLSGEIDSVASFASSDVARIQGAGYRIVSAVSAGVTDTLYPNLDKAPFNDLAVRQAFQVGFDRDAINKAVLNQYSPPATSPLSSPVPGYKSFADLLKYDPAKAKQILDQDGWTPGADGIRVKDGQRLTAHALITSQGDRAEFQLLQAQLKEIGFDLEIDLITQAEQTARIQSGDWSLIKGNFTRADPDVLLNTYHPDYVTFATYSHENVPDLTALLDKERGELDATERDATVAQAQELILSKGYSFPINESGRPVAYAPTVHGLTYSLPGWSVFYDAWKDAGS